MQLRNIWLSLLLALWCASGAALPIASVEPKYANAGLIHQTGHPLQTEGGLPTAEGQNSFPGKTLVHVRDRQGKPALKPIADIQVGDEVLAWDELAAHDVQLRHDKNKNSQELQAKTGSSAQQISAKRYEKVSDVFSSERERKLVHITLEGGKSLTATDGHPFRTSEGWRDAVLLKRGAKLLLMGSGEGEESDKAATTATIEDVRIEVKTTRVYNLEVENLHTFFVGEQGVVVHNATSGSGNGPIGRRVHCSSMKEAYDRAKRMGKGKEPIKHMDGEYGPHYHPDVPKPHEWTPKAPNPHDHYYFPR